MQKAEDLALRATGRAKEQREKAAKRDEFVPVDRAGRPLETNTDTVEEEREKEGGES